jgi:CDP-glycerol glycerophosphotransferase
MSTIKKIIKRLIILLVNLFVFILSLVIPKNDKFIIVGGWFGKRFADNSKHLFLYTNDNKNKLNIDKIIWVTRSKSIKEELQKNGFMAYNVWSLPSVWYHLRAKYHIVDQSPLDVNSFLSVRSKRINLWHGFPMKKIGTYMNSGKTNYNNGFLKLINKLTTRGCWGDHYLLATS